LVSFLGLMVGVASFCVTAWMAGTLYSKEGMNGFIYLLGFCFILGEIVSPLSFWVLFLRDPKFSMIYSAKESNLTSFVTSTILSTKEFKVREPQEQMGE